MYFWVSIRVLILDGCNLHHVRHGHEPVVLFLPYQLFLVFSWHRRDQYQFFGPNEPNYFKKKKIQLVIRKIVSISRYIQILQYVCNKLTNQE